MTNFTVDDLVIIQAAQQIMNNPTLRAPVRVPKIAVTVPYTNNSPTNAFQVFNANLQGSYGTRLFSVSLAVDSVFQTNYNWLINISSVTSPGQEYEEFDPTVNTFENVPTGNYLIKPGGNVTIYAYNRNSGNSTNGIMSVYMVYDQLSNTEYQIIQKYYSLLNSIAAAPMQNPLVTTQQTSTGVFPAGLDVVD